MIANADRRGPMTPHDGDDNKMGAVKKRTTPVKIKKRTSGMVRGSPPDRYDKEQLPYVKKPFWQSFIGEFFVQDQVSETRASVSGRP